MFEKSRTGIKTLEPLQAAEWFNQHVQKQGFGFYGKFLTIVLCSYFLADIAALVLGRYIPDGPPARNTRSGLSSSKRPKTIDDFNVIFARNLFNSQGLIPGEDVPNSVQDLGGTPTKSTLPFNLVGTMILRDELRSIATIEDKSASLVYPVRVDDEIPSKAKIVKIEPRKVIFVNTASGRREYIELPDEDTNNPRISLGTNTGAAPGIEKVAPNQYSISRSEIDKTLADMNNVLTQARAVPNFENGVAQGYKLFQIVPGSVYEKLGLQNGDAIVGIDGQPLNDPGQALGMISALKNAAHMELQIKRDGKPITSSYDFH